MDTETCVVRQPILNRDQKVCAYELLYQQDTGSLYNQQDSKVANAISQFFNQIGESNFLEQKDAFLTFTPNLLMQNIPRIFDEKKLVIQLEDNVLIHPIAQMIIQRYKKQGYRLALVDFEFNNRYFNVINLVDILKVDFSDLNSENIQTYISIARKFGKQVAAYNVNSPQALEKAKEYHCDFIQGKSVADMVSTTVRRMDHLQSNFFRLMVAITKDVPDFDEISHIIELDVTLTFSLMKMVNSAYFSLKSKVKDIKQALTILGLNQLKQWIYLLSFSSDGGLYDELIKISFQRATFCSSLSKLIPNFPLSASKAYLLGMFSTLDKLLQVPMEDALKELPIAEEIKEGLTTKKGICGELCLLCLSYEKGDWSVMGRHAQQLGLTIPSVAQKYFESIEYVNNTWNELIRPFATSGE